MSNISIYAKTKFILKMIDNIKKIIVKHGGIIKALEDELEAQPAILMALLQIGESLNKIDKAIIEKYHLTQEAKGSYDVRNFIAHDYERVRLEIVEDILRNSLEELEKKILKLSVDFE
jgi:uncharacterized protein with HEPN domain